MKIKWGALVVDGRGKLGGHVASKNKSGNYLRTKVTPTNPQTASQTRVRQIFASISSSWSGLSDVQRTSFNSKVESFSKTDIFGDLKSPTGKSLFQKLNQNLILFGLPNLVLCPDPEDIPQSVVTAGQIGDAGTVDWTGNVTIDVDNPACKAIVMASGSLSQGTTFVKNKLRHISNVDVLANANFIAIDVAKYQGKFGVPQSGDNIYVGIKFINTNGQVSPLQTVKLSIP